jgi:hypothetical protein
MHRAPHAKTIGKLGLLLGPSVVQQLHQNIVAQAQAEKIIRGHKLRVDTTVVETNIHYRMSRKGWCIQRESNPPRQESEASLLG